MYVLRRLGIAILPLLLVLASAPPALAGMALIETGAQLEERSDEAVKAAVVTAVETAARGAQAMGLSQVSLRGVRVLPNMVIVQIIATDSAPHSLPGEQTPGQQNPGQENPGHQTPNGAVPGPGNQNGETGPSGSGEDVGQDRL